MAGLCSVLSHTFQRENFDGLVKFDRWSRIRLERGGDDDVYEAMEGRGKTHDHNEGAEEHDFGGAGTRCGPDCNGQTCGFEHFQRDARALHEICRTQLLPPGEDADTYTWPSPMGGLDGPLNIELCLRIMRGIPDARHRQALLAGGDEHVIASGLKPRSAKQGYPYPALSITSGRKATSTQGTSTRARPFAVVALYDKLVAPVQSTKIGRWNFCVNKLCVNPLHAEHLLARSYCPPCTSTPVSDASANTRANASAAVAAAGADRPCVDPDERPPEPAVASRHEEQLAEASASAIVGECTICCDTDLGKAAIFVCSACCTPVCAKCAAEISYTCLPSGSSTCAWKPSDGTTMKCPFCRHTHTSLAWTAGKCFCPPCEASAMEGEVDAALNVTTCSLCESGDDEIGNRLVWCTENGCENACHQ